MNVYLIIARIIERFEEHFDPNETSRWTQTMWTERVAGGAMCCWYGRIQLQGMDKEWDSK